ncbi:ciliogenesis-associated TTC17-interacting protein-like [Aphidius gifuensis]|uniref:ciliogenesis-associated TTC17-interacting protein-like n=1 Tax=Aphidius gifuensis TaxID=684658 RepID=UPI001CDBA245|nr:ciliogenesis-associated TTC17-interacting protein-like [Aphidius gifuensis]
MEYQKQALKLPVINFDIITSKSGNGLKEKRHGDLLPNTIRCAITGGSNCENMFVEEALEAAFQREDFNAREVAEGVRGATNGSHHHEEDTGYDADDEVASEDQHLSMDIPFIDLISDNDDDVIHLIRDTRDQEYEDDDDDDDDQDASMDIPVIDLVSDDDDDEDDDDDDDADTVILEPEELVRRVEDADFYNCSYTPS